ncbi:aldo/keto reductase [Paenibacillus sp. Soil787]|uniref:aldo/keto reductase n=1 Tax=Paenibacillus sp. Soil787 TaxID=1736411 RepID=UPI0006F1F52B|nr:aldo/keto reductase [Paenibacillus sp. Soil787]KRF43762.1 hypothetical protein ASG93_02275 [Paenibacillus sp. Soil787]
MVQKFQLLASAPGQSGVEAGPALGATQCGLVWDENNNISKNGTYGSILREAEASLRRLGTDYIDLYQMHWPDTVTS